ncbi:uridine/cytidine kinase [bacterium BMS3Abin04]|nr:uridine/cytidine kinase [bacterium BMS3Abin04]
MKGDVLILEEHHYKAAKKIVKKIIGKIERNKNRYVIAVAGESGSGKSETAKALADELEKYGIKSVILGQDDYFHLPPKSNDAKRREDSEWLGPHVEVNLDALENNLKDAINGSDEITKPLVDYKKDTIEQEKISLTGIKVIIAEGTYTSLLKNVDIRIFIARSRLDTLAHRLKRNRGGEAEDPFVEQVLKTEHKIIAGHIQLADFVITKNYEVIIKD